MNNLTAKQVRELAEQAQEQNISVLEKRVEEKLEKEAREFGSTCASFIGEEADWVRENHKSYEARGFHVASTKVMGYPGVLISWAEDCVKDSGAIIDSAQRNPILVPVIVCFAFIVIGSLGIIISSFF